MPLILTHITEDRTVFSVSHTTENDALRFSNVGGSYYLGLVSDTIVIVSVARLNTGRYFGQNSTLFCRAVCYLACIINFWLLFDPTAYRNIYFKNTDLLFLKRYKYLHLQLT